MIGPSDLDGGQDPDANLAFRGIRAIVSRALTHGLPEGYSNCR